MQEQKTKNYLPTEEQVNHKVSPLLPNIPPAFQSVSFVYIAVLGVLAFLAFIFFGIFGPIISRIFF